MRFSLVIAAAALGAVGPSAQAQTAISQIAGLGALSIGSRPISEPVSTRRLPAYRMLRRSVMPEPEPQSEPHESDGPPEDAGPYRTMCVRACDGYYFPIRTYAQAKDVPGDAKRCQASCSSEAELYYFPTFGGAPATMVDLKGAKYSDHPKAFAFRKALSPGCVCKAPAWSEEAKLRHLQYERAEADALAARKAEAELAAEAQSQDRDDVVEAAPPSQPPTSLSPQPPDTRIAPPAARRPSRRIRFVQRIYVRPATSPSLFSW